MEIPFWRSCWWPILGAWMLLRAPKTFTLHTVDKKILDRNRVKVLNRRGLPSEVPVEVEPIHAGGC